MMSKEAMKLALEALEAGEYYIDDLEAIVYAADDLGIHEDRAKMQSAITALRKALAEQPAQQEPVALEAVYETIVHWDEGGGKRSRRELARRIVSLYTSPPAQRTWVNATTWRGLTDKQATKAALWDLAVSKGLVTVHTEQLAPGTWSAHLSVASWIEGHDKACDISNEAAHGIKENT